MKNFTDKYRKTLRKILLGIGAGLFALGMQACPLPTPKYGMPAPEYGPRPAYGPPAYETSIDDTPIDDTSISESND